MSCCNNQCYNQCYKPCYDPCNPCQRREDFSITAGEVTYDTGSEVGSLAADSNQQLATDVQFNIVGFDYHLKGVFHELSGKIFQDEETLIVEGDNNKLEGRLGGNKAVNGKHILLGISNIEDDASDRTNLSAVDSIDSDYISTGGNNTWGNVKVNGQDAKLKAIDANGSYLINGKNQGVEVHLPSNVGDKTTITLDSPSKMGKSWSVEDETDVLVTLSVVITKSSAHQDYTIDVNVKSESVLFTK